jgi:hypothetical protein
LDRCRNYSGELPQVLAVGADIYNCVVADLAAPLDSTGRWERPILFLGRFDGVVRLLLWGE